MRFEISHLSANYTWGNLVDNTNTLWVSVFGKGVDYTNLNHSKLIHRFTKEDALVNNVYNYTRGVAEDNTGNIWCCPLNNGIIQLDKNFKFKQKLKGFEKYGTVAFGINNNELYFGDKELNIVNVATNKIQKLNFPSWVDKSKAGFEHLSFMKDNNVLMSGRNGLWLAKKGATLLDTIAGVTHTNSWVMYGFEDTAGNIYECTYFNGFTVYKKNNKTYQIAFSLAEAITVHSIFQQSANMVWIGTSNGLYLYNPIEKKIVKKYTTENGLPDNIIYAIQTDNENRLWFSTNNGLALLLPDLKTVKSFTANDGIQGVEFNTNTVCRLKNGHLLFGGTNGLNEIIADELSINKNMPAIEITGIKTNTAINPFAFSDSNKTLTLPAGTNYFELNFVAIELDNPLANQLKYKLTGLDNDWVSSVNPGYVRYAKLPPGNYTFEIMAANADGIWNTTVKKLHIEMLPYWWQTNLFKFLLTAFIIGLIAIAIQAYIRRKLVQQKIIMQQQQVVFIERERIAKDLHDNIGASLSSINMLSEVAKQRQQSINEPLNNALEKISQTSVEAISDMKDSIWFIEPKHQSCNHVIERLRQYAEPVCAELHIALHVNYQANLTLDALPLSYKKNIYLVLKEGVNNAIKYAGAKNIYVHLCMIDNAVQFEVKDDGKGIPDNYTAGNGIKNMQQRVQGMNGTLQFLNLKKGLHIKASIPLTKIGDRQINKSV